MTPRDELLEEIAKRYALSSSDPLTAKAHIEAILHDFAARSDAQVPRSGCEIADMLSGHPPLERRKGEQRSSRTEIAQLWYSALANKKRELYT